MTGLWRQQGKQHKMAARSCLAFLCFVSTSAIKPEDCLLYPVPKDSSTSFENMLGDNNTWITLESVSNLGPVSSIMLDDVCVVGVNHRNTKISSYTQCMIDITSCEARVNLLVSVKDDQTWMVQVGSRQWQETSDVTLNSSSNITIQANNLLNVAFNCLEGCFRFQGATTISRTFVSSHGSFTFYGRCTQTNLEQEGDISILQGKYHNTTRKMNKFKLQPMNWTKFKFKLTFNNNEGMGFNFTKHTSTSTTVIENINDVNKYVDVIAKHFILYFNNTNDIEWVLCLTPNDTGNTNIVPSTTYTPSHNFPGGNTKSQPCDALLIVKVLGVVCLILLLTLIASCVRLCRTKANKDPPPANPPHLTENTMQEAAEDGLYDDFNDLQEVRLRRIEGENGGPSSFTRDNSLYGCVFTDRDVGGTEGD